jgi:hypothetical protein
MDVLGIDVDRAELVRWLDWYMPSHQPFLVPGILLPSVDWTISPTG